MLIRARLLSMIMSKNTSRKFGWPVISTCLALSLVCLSAVPFIGSRYGDSVEACALAAGMLPLVFAAIRVVMHLHRRLKDIERRVQGLQRS